MKITLSQRLSRIGLSALLFSGNVVLAYATETNLWAERKRSIEAERPTQLASLPALLETPLVPSLARKTDFQMGLTKNEQRLPTSLTHLLQQIPAQLSTLQKADNGDGQQDPVLILQDIHLNPEAQTNSSKILEALVRQKISVIGVEGVFVPFEFTELRGLAPREKIEQTAKEFIEKKWMASPSYVGLTTNQDLSNRMVGVDDKKLYDENVAAYLDGRKTQARAVDTLKRTKQENFTQAQKFSAPAQSLFNLQENYNDQKVSFGDYTKKLAQLEKSDDLVIAQFLEAYALEKSMNFSAVDHDRRIVVERLATKLSPHELKDLSDRTVAYQAGQIGFGNFYRHLRDLCREKGIELSTRPAFLDGSQ
jgi:hypothetical protein